MKTLRIVALLFMIVLLTGCSLFNPRGPSIPGGEPPPAAVTEAPDTPAPPPQPAATCIPQASGPCAPPNPDEPVQITGDIPYTNPFFLNSISQPFVMLEDEAGFVNRDKQFLFPLAGQEIGPVQVDADDKLTYFLALPAVPQATLVDVDNNGNEDLGVQVLAVAYWSNIWGDPFLEERDGKGWSTAYTSAITDPEQEDEIVGGILVVFAPDGDQGFPTDFGPDGKLFTEDDPTAPIPAGYNLVDLDEQPFRVYKERNPNLTLQEGAGAVKDYTDLSYSEAFDTLFEKVSLEYPFTVEKGIAWDALHQEFKPRFDDVASDQDMYRTLRDFISKIPDGHIYVSLDQEVFFADYGGGLGLVFDRLSDQRVIVKEVLPGTPADSAGIQQGAEILSWNDEPINDAIQKVAPGLGPASTEHSRQRAQIAFLARLAPDTQVEIGFQNPDDAQEQTETLQAVIELDSLFRTIPGANADDLETPIVGEVLDESGLGYLRINTFSDDYALLASLWDRYVNNLIDNEVPGLIIDLRENPGGSLGLAMDYTGFFFDKETTLYDNYYYSETSGQFESTGYPTKIKPAPLYYDRPIVLLVSPDCVSACEGFAYAMRNEQRSIVIGHYPTAGAFGEVGLGQYRMPGDFTMQFPTGRPQSPDGTVIIEGTGVVPDITVPVTVESALGQVDAVLDAAIQALLEEIQ